MVDSKIRRMETPNRGLSFIRLFYFNLSLEEYTIIKIMGEHESNHQKTREFEYCAGHR
jgi:hypothetical protein